MERAHDVSLVELQMLAEALAGNACPVQSAAAVRRFVMLAAKEGRATNRWERPERDLLTHQREIETEMQLCPNLQFFDSLAHHQ